MIRPFIDAKSQSEGYENYTQWGMLQRTMLQGTIFINKIRTLQRRRRNTIGRRSTRVRMTCQAFPL